VLLLRPISELQTAYRDVLGASSLKHGERHPSPSSKLPKSTQPPSLSLFRVDSAIALVGADTFVCNILSYSPPRAHVFHVKTRLPLQLNTQNHTQGVQSTNQVPIDDSHDEAVLQGQDMGSFQSCCFLPRPAMATSRLAALRPTASAEQLFQVHSAWCSTGGRQRNMQNTPVPLNSYC